MMRILFLIPMLVVAFAATDVNAQCCNGKKEVAQPVAEKAPGSCKEEAAKPVAEAASECCKGGNKPAGCGDKTVAEKATGTSGVVAAPTGSDVAANGCDAAATGCDAAAKAACDAAGTTCSPALSACLAKMAAGLESGCDKSGYALAALEQASGRKGVKLVQEHVAYLEKCLADGCSKSKGELTKLQNAVQLAIMPLNKRVQLLAKGAEKGCETSKLTLASLTQVVSESAESCSGCPKQLAASMVQLEKWAAGGCDASGVKLTKVRKVLLKSQAPKKPQAMKPVAELAAPLSDRIAKWSVGSRKGCGTSSNAIAALQKATGACCSSERPGMVAKLEKSAAKGCATSKQRLVELESALTQAKKKATAPNGQIQ